MSDNFTRSEEQDPRPTFDHIGSQLNDERAAGQAVMTSAVERQQVLLAARFGAEQAAQQLERDARFSFYLNQLSSGETVQPDLAEEFYLPRGIGEAIQIIDAGGVSYGIC